MTTDEQRMTLRSAIRAVEDMIAREHIELGDEVVLRIAKLLRDQAKPRAAAVNADKRLERAIEFWSTEVRKSSKGSSITEGLRVKRLRDAVLAFRVEFETTGEPAGWYKLENLIAEKDWQVYADQWQVVLAALRVMPRTPTSQFFNGDKQLIMRDMRMDGTIDIRSYFGARPDQEGRVFQAQTKAYEQTLQTQSSPTVQINGVAIPEHAVERVHEHLANVEGTRRGIR